MSNLEGARHKAEATERDLAEARKVAAAWHDKVGGEHAFLVCLFVTVVCVLGVGVGGLGACLAAAWHDKVGHG